MADYKCFGCGKELAQKDIKNRVICPYCSERIILKIRPKTIKQVKAR